MLHPKDLFDANLSEPFKGAEVVTLKWQWVGVLFAGENHFLCNRSVAQQSLSGLVSSFLCHPKQNPGSGLEAAQLNDPLFTKCQLPPLLFQPLCLSPGAHKTTRQEPMRPVTNLTCFRKMVGQAASALVDPGNLVHSNISREFQPKLIFPSSYFQKGLKNYINYCLSR